MGQIREPAVAGSFYPSEQTALVQQLSNLFDDAKDVLETDSWAVVAPHAGYKYSGIVAAEVYAHTTTKHRFVILGPNHRGAGAPLATSAAETWRTPLGDVSVDVELRDHICNLVPGLAIDDRAHAFEHSLEVHLPFLQVRNDDIQIVPISMYRGDYSLCAEIGDALGSVMQQDDDGEIMLIASTDMTHYEPDDVARDKDEFAMKDIEALDSKGLYDTVRNHRISMCGVLPTVAVVRAAESVGAQRALRVDYRTSGEVTGDLSRVVGYAGFVIPREQQ